MDINTTHPYRWTYSCRPSAASLAWDDRVASSSATRALYFAICPRSAMTSACLSFSSCANEAERARLLSFASACSLKCLADSLRASACGRRHRLLAFRQIHQTSPRRHHLRHKMAHTRHHLRPWPHFCLMLGFRPGVPGRDDCMPPIAYLPFLSPGFKI